MRTELTREQYNRRLEYCTPLDGIETVINDLLLSMGKRNPNLTKEEVNDTLQQLSSLAIVISRAEEEGVPFGSVIEAIHKFES